METGSRTKSTAKVSSPGQVVCHTHFAGHVSAAGESCFTRLVLQEGHMMETGRWGACMAVLFSSIEVGVERRSVISLVQSGCAES